jgi:hypothetical protein
MKILQQLEPEKVRAKLGYQSIEPEDVEPYLDLAKEGLVNCSTETVGLGRSAPVIWYCKGVRGKDPAFSTETANGYGPILVAGELVPREITGISTISESTALAEVRYTVRPTALYAKYKKQFDRIVEKCVSQYFCGPMDRDGSTISSSPNRDKNPWTEDRIRTAGFRRFDDGWRLESIR